jgi:hypothetical protein
MAYPRKLACCATLACLTWAYTTTEAQRRRTATGEIPEGTHVLLRLQNSVSTRTARQGDYVYMRTATPISVDGQVLVPVGSYVQGIVSHVKRSGRVAGRAELALHLQAVTLPGGQILKFSPRLDSVDSNRTDQKVDREESAVKQGSSHGHDAAQVVIWAGRGAAIGGVADRSWKGAGIGGGAGSAVGLAQVMLTRGREVELHQGSTLDVIFDRRLILE